MAIRVFIDGAAGTTGLEIRERLAGRGEFELLVLDDAQRKDEAARKDALHEADVAILCLPDDAAREAVALAEGSSTRIIDASSAHRVADGWTYGFPEIIGHEAVANAQFVSNPGCYPTGFLALVAPLVKAEVIEPDWPYSVNAVSGYSGGGNALIERFGDDQTIAFRAYGLGLDHKHLPEMQKYAQLGSAPVFSPAVVPVHRGMIVDVPISLDVMLDERFEEPALPVLLRTLKEQYKNSQVVTVNSDGVEPTELLLRQSADPWDGMELFVFEGDYQARLIARLDNLGKGASGAAIQNLNIMCGLSETAGLRL
ncbi:MAG: N-acetyl-gamma-glutamyl-phosphate reductase [Pseudomonadota bacterium]